MTHRPGPVTAGIYPFGGLCKKPHRVPQPPLFRPSGCPFTRLFLSLCLYPLSGTSQNSGRGGHRALAASAERGQTLGPPAPLALPKGRPRVGGSARRLTASGRMLAPTTPAVAVVAQLSLQNILCDHGHPAPRYCGAWTGGWLPHVRSRSRRHRVGPPR